MGLKPRPSTTTGDIVGMIEAVAADPAPKAWGRSDPSVPARRALRIHAALDDRPDRLAATLGRLDPLDRLRLGAALVKRAFAAEVASLGDRMPRPTLPTPPAASLTAAQRALLTLLARFDSGWGSGDQRYWLERLGLPLCPPAMREYFGEPACPENLCDRVVELGGGRGPLYERLPAICRDDTEDVAALGRSLAARFDPAESVELVELAARVIVPSKPALITACVHAIVAHGGDAAAPLTARLERLAAASEGVASVAYWSYGVRGGSNADRCTRYIALYVPIVWLAALGAVAPDSGPRLVGRLDTVAVERARGWITDGRLEARAAGWIAAALDRAVARG